MKKKFLIGIDLGGTKISSALVTSSGKIIAREKQSTPPKASGPAIYKTIIDLIEETCDDGGIKLKNIVAVGIGIPGIVDSHTRQILATPNIDLAGFPLEYLLSKKLHKPVVLDNDVNLGLLGEQWLGAAKGHQTVLGLFPGTGLGGGIIINGRIFSGIQGAAAEFGHMLVDPDGPLCSCGNRGCLEAVSSRWAIQRDLRAAIQKGRKTIITDLTDGRLDVIKSRFLKEALERKDKLVIETLTKVSLNLGKACVSLNHIFNPEMIVLGGGVMEACGHFILPKVKKIVAGDPFFVRFNRCRVVQSKLEDDAVLLGAVALAKQHLP